jgi:hypothetical protein
MHHKGQNAEADRDTVGAAIWVAQMTSRYNMLTEAGDAWTSAMCVLALWGRADLVDWMNALERGWCDAYEECFLGVSGRRAVWEGIARGAPHGADYGAAAVRWGEGAPAKALFAFEGRNGLDWVQTLEALAGEACYAEGLRARGVLELRAARGVTEPHLLKAIGAQLVARRPDPAGVLPHPAIAADGR